jgi:hypothetical protein
MFEIGQVFKFQTYFYMKNLIDYNYNMKIFKSHWYILEFHPFESIKNSIVIALSSYFHIFIQKWDTYFPILK